MFRSAQKVDLRARMALGLTFEDAFAPGRPASHAQQQHAAAQGGDNAAGGGAGSAEGDGRVGVLGGVKGRLRYDAGKVRTSAATFAGDARRAPQTDTRREG